MLEQASMDWRHVSQREMLVGLSGRGRREAEDSVWAGAGATSTDLHWGRITLHTEQFEQEAKLRPRPSRAGVNLLLIKPRTVSNPSSIIITQHAPESELAAVDRVLARRSCRPDPPARGSFQQPVFCSTQRQTSFLFSREITRRTEELRLLPCALMLSPANGGAGDPRAAIGRQARG